MVLAAVAREGMAAATAAARGNIPVIFMMRESSENLLKWAKVSDVGFWCGVRRTECDEEKKKQGSMGRYLCEKVSKTIQSVLLYVKSNIPVSFAWFVCVPVFVLSLGSGQGRTLVSGHRRTRPIRSTRVMSSTFETYELLVYSPSWSFVSMVSTYDSRVRMYISWLQWTPLHIDLSVSH